MSPLLSQVADMLHEATRSGLPIAPVRNPLPTGNIDAAYAVQNISTGRAVEVGSTAALEPGTSVCGKMQSLGRASIATAAGGAA